MEIDRLLATLHPLERKVLPFLSKVTTAKELVEQSGLKDVEVIRALQWLENKKVLDIQKSSVDKVFLDKLGKLYLDTGLPEKRLLHALSKKSLDIKQAEKMLEQQELNASLGLLRKKGAVSFEKGKIAITEQGKKELKKESLEEQLLKKLEKGIEVGKLKPEEKLAFANLKKRKQMLLVKTDKSVSFVLSDLGKKLSKQKISAEKVIDRLDPEHLKLGKWKGKTFRRYDTTINVPRTSFGRKHHYRSFLDEVRSKFTALGFKEMTGPLVETDFWDMDALFMPQFHAARDIHEAYYINAPTHGKVEEKFLKAVKAVHEDGGKTGSKGWRYSFDTKRTKRLLLRTQGTACSARMLASKDLEIPGKYFGLTKCFRYDVIDATHLPDFYQTEGMVLEEGLSLAHLKGLLKLFAEEFGQCDQVKIRPGYFPFTEPSCELFAKHPEMGWIELGGAGIFRPEVTSPFGITVPVLAWGLGIDRIGMFNMKIKDIRELYSHNLEFLKYVRMR